MLGSGESSARVRGDDGDIDEAVPGRGAAAERDDQKTRETDEGGEGKQSKGDERQAGGDKKEDGDKGEGEKKRRWPVVVLILVVIAAVIGGAIYWYLTRNQESTDDAYTEGNAVMIAPNVAGYVVERLVDDNSFVRAGDLMMRIDPRDYIAARDQAVASLDLARAQLANARIDLQIARVRAPADLQQAQASLQQARANLTNADREAKRQRDVDPRATTQTSIDTANTQQLSARATVSSSAAQVEIAALVPQNIQSAESTVKQREAQVQQAAANLAQSELNLAYTEVRAPQDGKVTRRNVDVGTYAQAGQQIFYLVSPQTWVVANFKETQLDRMRPGQEVDIGIDAYPDMKIRGHIDSIQQGSGARFTTFPTENATGNFVKIVRRVPVKILLDSGVDQRVGLPLGLSVTPTVLLQ